MLECRTRYWLTTKANCRACGCFWDDFLVIVDQGVLREVCYLDQAKALLGTVEAKADALVGEGEDDGFDG